MFYSADVWRRKSEIFPTSQKCKKNKEEEKDDNILYFVADDEACGSTLQILK